MRKPLVVLSVVLSASFGTASVVDTLAAPATASNPTKNTPPAPPALSSNRTTAAAGPSNSVSGAQIVQLALKYQGYPYTATGNSPATGFSCVGFTSYVLRSLGIQIPGDLPGSLAFARQVPFSQLQPGDLLYFQYTLPYMPRLSHDGIYIGNGKFIHSEYYGYGVRISSFYNDPKDGNYWIQHYMTANRPWGGAAVSPVISAPAQTSVVRPTVKTTSQVAVIGGKRAVVTVARLNVRSAPSRWGSIITVTTQGTEVTILGRSKRKAWYKVQLPNGTIGWVVAFGIGMAQPAGTPSATANKVRSGLPSQPARTGYPSVTRPRVMTTIQVSGLRVHTNPSLGAPVITSLAAGQKVRVVSQGKTWTKVQLAGGQIGYVARWYTSAGATTGRARARKVRYTTPSRSTAGSAVQGTARLTAGVRIHAGPGLSARVIGTAIAGTRVTVLGRSGKWVLVRLPGGRTGYVFGLYVRR